MLPSQQFFKEYTKDNRIPWQERSVLTEYLQVITLKCLSQSSCKDKISFLGGTALRLGWGLSRFSEDLDFDLLNKRKFDIEKLKEDLIKQFQLLNFKVDIRTKKTENIFIIYLRFNEVLRPFGFSVPKNQKLLIKFEIDYDPPKNIITETRVLNGFRESFPLVFNTLETIYAQKMIALMFRPYQKSRDIYDIRWFIFQKNLEPNYKLLAEKGIKVKNKAELVSVVKERLLKMDLKKATVDVRRFLFDPREAEWIRDLPKYLDSACHNNGTQEQ